MKKLILYNIFILILYAISLIFYNFNFKPLTQQELAYKDLEAKHSELLFIGTSHFYSSIDPDYIDKNITTLSTGSLNYLYQLEILKNALMLNERLQHVFIEIDYIPLLINTLDNRVRRFECDFKDLFQLGLNYENLPGLSFKKYLLFKFKHLLGFDHVINAPTYNLKEIVFFEDNNLTSKKRPGFTNNSKNYDLISQERPPRENSIYDQLEINTKAFLDIINLCKRKNITITYIRFPRFNPILDYQNYIIDLIIQNDSENFNFFSADNHISFEINDFKDNNHLNLSGARKYSLALNNFLNDNNY